MQFRRLVTILFVDVVESMALAEALDPEALGAVLQRYFETVSAALTRHGGTVEKYAGDAVMAAFGIPSRTRTTRFAPRAPRSTSAPGSPRSTSGSCSSTESGSRCGSGSRQARSLRRRPMRDSGSSPGRRSGSPPEARAGGRRGRDRRRRARRPADRPRGAARAARGARDQGQARAGPGVPPRRDRRPSRRRSSGAWTRRSSVASASSPRSGGRSSARSTARRLASRSSSARPGSGKSRLAAELTRRAKGVTTLSGPLPLLRRGHHVLAATRGARAGATRATSASRPRRARGRDAAARARDRLALPPVLRGECARAAARPRLRRRPLGGADLPRAGRAPRRQGEGPILVVCLAREELLEETARRSSRHARTPSGSCSTRSRPTRPTRSLEGLGGAILESDQRARVVEAAEGNPLFLEQLLALALEGGLDRARVCRRRSRRCSLRASTGSAPASAPCSSAARSSGKEFTADDVVALLDPDAAPTADTHLDARRTRLRAAARRRRVRLPPCPRAGGGLPRGAEAAACGAARALRRPARRRRRRICPSSTSSSATTSSRRIGCATELGESDGETSSSAEDAGAGSARRVFAPQARRHARVARICSAARPRLLPRVAGRAASFLCELGIVLGAPGEPTPLRRAAERR